MFLLILSFVAGVLTVLAPCTLALLPVIVGSSIDGTGGSKKKAFTIAISLGLSVIVFTLLLKASTLLITVPQSFWAFVSGSIIIVFGLISLFPALWERMNFVSRLSIESNKMMSAGYQKKSFWGDVIIGASLGPVFSTCSPTYFVVLATVLPQSFFLGFIDLVAYAVGLSGMLLLVAIFGQKMADKMGGISDTHGWFKKTLGVLFLIIGISIMFGVDKKIETKILDYGAFDITKVEQALLKLSEENEQDSEEYSIKTSGPKAPEIVNPSGFINTDDKPITISEFKGKKVVLLDIWTYSCINCQRTLPYLKSWHEKYKDQGLVIIGLHTPEFAFEKVKSNVEDAVKDFGLEYPIVMDNEYATWRAYGNRYWPRKYLINVNGEIIYDHIGEGNYEETERAIQEALSELNRVSVDESITTPEGVISVDSRKVGSPEIYFGAGRNEYLANGLGGILGTQTLSIPTSIKDNALYLGGAWKFSEESATSLGVGRIVFKYEAKNVYMVLSSEEEVSVKVYKDGVFVKDIKVKNNKLYSIVEGDDYGKHILEIETPAGLEAFTFTFG